MYPHISRTYKNWQVLECYRHCLEVEAVMKKAGNPLYNPPGFFMNILKQDFKGKKKKNKTKIIEINEQAM